VLIEIFAPNVIKPRVPERWYSAAEYLARILINLLTGVV